jgi:hypothetical protein
MCQDIGGLGRRPLAAAAGILGLMRIGIAHHYGWAATVTASGNHRVVDRRRIALLEPDLPAAPIHHEGGTHPLHGTAQPLDDDTLAALVARVRASALRTTAASLDELAAALPEPVTSLALREWPDHFPQEIATQRRVPHESRADSVMYLTVLAELAHQRGWNVRRYHAKDVEQEAARLLGDRANDVLYGPRRTLGPPWGKDQRMALAATVLPI